MHSFKITYILPFSSSLLYVLTVFVGAGDGGWLDGQTLGAGEAEQRASWKVLKSRRTLCVIITRGVTDHHVLLDSLFPGFHTSVKWYGELMET